MSDQHNQGQQWGQRPPVPGPQWGAPPPPPKKKRLVPVLLGVGAFIIVIGIIGAVTGGGDKKDDTSDSAATPSVTTAVTDDSKPAADATTKAAVKTTPPKPKPKPKPKVVLTETGSGIKSTAKFTVDGDWDLKYRFDCASFGTAGNFVVSKGGGMADLYLNELAKSGSDVTHLHDGGTMYLEINSECSWRIDVIDIP